MKARKKAEQEAAEKGYDFQKSITEKYDTIEAVKKKQSINFK